MDESYRIYGRNHHPYTCYSLVMTLTSNPSRKGLLLSVYYTGWQKNSSDFHLAFTIIIAPSLPVQKLMQGICHLVRIFIAIVHYGNEEIAKVGLESCWAYYEMDLNILSC